MVALYGSAGYGVGDTHNRIHVLLAAAQSASFRKSALRVSVINPQTNKWSLLTGGELLCSSLSYSGAATSQSYQYYRLGMSMCILGNGKIVRVRVGNGSQTDRNIYYQEITSPTTASQWTTWNLLYSGTHFAVAVAPATATTYHVYTAKVDGIYKNNASRYAIAGVIGISPVIGQTDAMFISVVRADPSDGGRVIDHYYCPNLETDVFTFDSLNYRWLVSELIATKLSDGRIARIQVAGFYTDPRSTDLAESLTISFGASYTSIEPSEPPRLIRGFAGQAGSNAISHPYLVQLSDGYYYLFYGELRYDSNKTAALSSQLTVFWQRSLDLLHWSEPMAIGYPNMIPTGIGAVETGGHVYLANNGAVYSRPVGDIVYDISDYVGDMSLEQPNENQEGSGSFSIANPGAINTDLMALTDCEVRVEAGILCTDGVYRYVEFGKWWLDSITNDVDRNTNRLQAKLYDLWKRLDNKLRDNYNNIGQVIWHDWVAGEQNRLDNYYTRGGISTAIPVNAADYAVAVTEVTSSNAVLFTGVKSHNGIIAARIRAQPLAALKLGLVYRYADENNYYWVQTDGSTTSLIRVLNGVSTTLATHADTIYTWFNMVVDYRWGVHRVYIDGSLRFTYTETQPGCKPGYAGVRGQGGNYGFYNFAFIDWETPITTDDLVKTLLAMGDFHAPSVAAGGAQQLALVWGPQTDLNTPAKALRSICEQYKLDIAWRGGRVEVGQFKESTIAHTYENQITHFERKESVGRRINLAMVDGREDTWTEIDGDDTRLRSRQIVDYFDVPELTTDDAVRTRAQEEIRKGVIGSEYEADLPLQMDLWRMDGIQITDNSGEVHQLRVQGFTIDIAQNEKPHQRMQLALSPLT